MLEQGFDQAAGLAALKLRPPTRVLPIVESSHGQTSLELMWRLESALRELGQAVAVVEGTQGLSVHDARQGHRQILWHWLEGVPPGAVVLLHAPLEALAVLLADSEARPLVGVTHGPRDVVEAYNAVKVLWQVAMLIPVVLLMDSGQPHPDASLERVSETLRANCERHLCRVPVIWPLEYHRSVNMPSGLIDPSCVLKVLDTALVLDRPENRAHVPISHKPRPNPAADQNVGVSDVHRQRHA